MSKEIAKTVNTQLSAFEDQLAAMAMDTVKAEQTGAAFLSTKGGALTYRGNNITDNKLACVVLAAPIERLYYDSRYDPTKIVGPKCFAIAQIQTGMGPAPSVEKSEHSTCEGCPKNEWGSASNGGKGKACRETRRLLLIPADSIGSASAVAAAEVAALRPPVTSLKNYSSYVQTLAATLKRPPLAVVTEISVVPDAKTQFKVEFKMLKAIDDMDVVRALMNRMQAEVDRAIATAGAVNEESGEATAPQSDRF